MLLWALHEISIHALRVEGDFSPSFGISKAPRFLSTPSGWRATSRSKVLRTACRISIHALRVEGDQKRQRRPRQLTRFLSTPSGWRATFFASCAVLSASFLSTPSGWRATIICCAAPWCRRISIHALRVEGDLSFCCVLHLIHDISIHALRVEGDQDHKVVKAGKRNFYPRPPGGGRRYRLAPLPAVCSKFLSTPSGWRATRRASTDVSS